MSEPATDEKASDAVATRGTPLEWVIAALGGILVVATIVYLAAIGLSTPGGPPSIIVRALAVQPSGDGYLVQFRAENSGGASAANIVIEGRLVRDGEQVARGETVLDYVAENSFAEGGVFLGEDPASGNLEMVALGYADP